MQNNFNSDIYNFSMCELYNKYTSYDSSHCQSITNFDNEYSLLTVYSRFFSYHDLTMNDIQASSNINETIQSIMANQEFINMDYLIFYGSKVSQELAIKGLRQAKDQQELAFNLQIFFI